MNRGSALKWIDQLNKTDWIYEPSQLRYESEGSTYGNVFGVLANFLDPTAWKLAWDEVSYIWNGSQFILSPEDLKRIKLKHDIYEPIDFGGNVGSASIYQVENNLSSFKQFATFLEHHYGIL